MYIIHLFCVYVYLYLFVLYPVYGVHSRRITYGSFAPRAAAGAMKAAPLLRLAVWTVWGRFCASVSPWVVWRRGVMYWHWAYWYCVLA